MTKSRIFFLSCLSFIAGVFAGSYYSISVWTLFLLAGIFIPFVFLSGANKKVRIMFLLLALFLLGAARVESGKLSEVEISKINRLNNQNVSIEGKVSGMPELKNGKQKITVENIKGAKESDFINGKIIVYANRYPEYNFSDRIKLEGKIKIPEDFDEFEYKNYLFSKNIYYISYYPKIELIEKSEIGFYFQIVELRKRIDDLIKKIFPQPQAGIIKAIMLGAESDISEEIIENFNKTGTRHILAVSGFNITIVAVVLMQFLLILGLKRDRAFYFSILGIAFFVALAGFPASAVRAAIMGGLVLLAVKVGRLTNAGNAIVFACCLMLLHSPGLLRYDIGFQLSFAAVLGIIYIFPRLNSLFEKYPDLGGVKTIFLITISAQIATLPIIVNSFGNFSLISVLANISILPFVPAVTIGGFLVTIIGFLNFFVAQIFSWPIWLVLSYQIEVINFFSSFDFALVKFENAGFWFSFLYYAILILVLNFRKLSVSFPQGNSLIK